MTVPLNLVWLSCCPALVHSVLHLIMYSTISLLMFKFNLSLPKALKSIFLLILFLSNKKSLYFVSGSIQLVQQRKAIFLQCRNLQ